MYWYHLAGICNFRVDWKKNEHLIDNPGDSLLEARQYARTIKSSCKDIEYSLRGEDIDISSELNSILSSADDIEGLQNEQITESLAQFNQVEVLCNDQFNVGTKALHDIRELHDMLTAYRDNLKGTEMHADLQSYLEDIIDKANDIDSDLTDMFCYCTDMFHLIQKAGWNQVTIDRVKAMFPVEKRHMNKYLYSKYEAFQSQGNLRYSKENNGVLLWSNGEQVGIEYSCRKMLLDSNGNVWLTADSVNDKLVCFAFSELDNYFIDSMKPTPDEIAVYAMVNPHAYRLEVINFCRGALELY